MYDELRELENQSPDEGVAASDVTATTTVILRPSVITSFFIYHRRPDRRDAMATTGLTVDDLVAQYMHASQTEDEPIEDALASLALTHPTNTPPVPTYPTELHRTLDHLHHANILCLCTWKTDQCFDDDATTTTYLLTGATDRTVRLTAWPRGEVLATLTHHNSPVLNVAVHPNGRWLLTSAMDGTHALVDLMQVDGVAPRLNDRNGSETGVLSPIALRRTHTATATTATATTATTPATAVTTTVTDLSASCRVWRDHTKYVVRVAFSPCGQYFITASYDHTARLYQCTPKDADTTAAWGCAATFHLNGAVESVCVSPDAQHILLGVRGDPCLQVIALTTGFPRTAYPLHRHAADAGRVDATLMDLVFHPSGRWVVAMTDAQQLQWRAWPPPPIPHRWPVRCVDAVAAPDPWGHPRCTFLGDHGAWLAATDGRDHRVAVIDTATGRVVQRLAGHTGVVRAMTYDAATGMLWTTGFDQTVKAFNRPHDENVH